VSGAVSSEADKSEPDASRLCEHLKPVLNELLRRGAAVAAVELDAWTECDVSVVLDRGLSLPEAERELELPSCVELWRNRDPHYSPNTGLFCSACKHSLGWPSKEGLPASGR
jgi:hypothetical protein